MIKILINNKIKISGLSTERQKLFKKLLTLDNPIYHLMKAMKKSLYAVPRVIKYYSYLGDDIVIPRGMLSRLKTYLEKYNIPHEITDRRVETKLAFELPEFELRDYQKETMDKIFPMNADPQEGVVTMTTGSGKTACAIEITRRLGLQTTIIVPNRVLLRQFVSEFKKFVDYDVGVLYSAEKIIKPITVVTWNILGNKERLKEIVDQTGVMIIDEIQGCVSPKRKKTLQSFRAKYMYGLTATPMRTDGQTDAIFFLMGQEIENYVGKQMQPRIECWHTKEKIPIRPEYHEMIDEMVENESRNKLITYIVMDEINAGRKVLVLTKRIQHYENIRKIMPDWGEIYYIDSKDPDRDWMLNGMKTGCIDFNVIFGTTSLLAVGTDIPCLDTVVIACDMKSPVLTTQSIGRIRRLFEGKTDPKVVDLHDTLNYKLNNQAKCRMKLYKEKGWKYKYVNSDIW